MRSFVIVMLLLVSVVCVAGDFQGGGGPNAWYQLPHTPREIAMGRTGIASATSVSAFVWNPALSSFETNASLSTAMTGRTGNKRSWASSRLEGFDQHNSLWAVLPVATNSRLGVHLRSWLVYDVAETQLNTADQIVVNKRMKVSSVLGEVNYSLRAQSIDVIIWAIGVNIRTVSMYYPGRKLEDSYWGKGVDVGLSASLSQKIMVGVVYRADQERSHMEGDIWQSMIGAGLAYTTPLSEKWRWQIAADAVTGNYSPGCVSIGSEFVWRDSAFFRFGGFWDMTTDIDMRSPSDATRFNPMALSAGLGFRWGDFHLDIAYEYSLNSNLYRTYIQPDLYLSLVWRRHSY